MTEVPESAIPAAAWGLSGRALTAEEITREDPFGGTGLRLSGQPGRHLTVPDVHDGTGMDQVIIYDGEVIWVNIGAGGDPAAVTAAWQAWLAQEEVTDST